MCHAHPKVLDKAIAVLFLIGPAAGPVKLADIARQTGLTRSTAYRIVQGLIANELVARHRSSGYVAGRRLRELNSNAQSSMVQRYKPFVTPSMVDLQTRTGGVVVTGTLHQGWTRFNDVWHPRKYVHVAHKLTVDAPPYCTATGKAILAYLNDPTFVRIERYTEATVASAETLQLELAGVRKSGVAYSREEYIVGVSAAASPVFLPGKSVPFAAISVGGNAEEIDLFACSVLVRQAAQEITTAILADQDRKLIRPWKA